ncbi:hypothetical protein CDAR_294501 [Caerostris darwini]|uniref:Uncharacterized protein n=1 Tax=Caerostris darwini TaxID=1538125 RepID=A0AAV4UKP3_9ARAC|nr:hypothetical protein CDAR_294501 [Caerostris darwini]
MSPPITPRNDDSPFLSPSARQIIVAERELPTTCATSGLQVSPFQLFGGCREKDSWKGKKNRKEAKRPGRGAENAPLSGGAREGQEVGCGQADPPTGDGSARRSSPPFLKVLLALSRA